MNEKISKREPHKPKDPLVTRRQFLRDLAGGVINTGVAGVVVTTAVRAEKEKIYKGKMDTEIQKFQQAALIPKSPIVLEKQFDPTEESGLIDEIRKGNVSTELAVALYFGHKKVRNAEGITRLDYVQFEMDFDTMKSQERWLSVQKNVRPMIPGLCAQESKFNNNAHSKSGAQGIFQFIPQTWKELSDQLIRVDEQNGIKKPKPISLLSLKDQTRAAGKHFSNIYRRLYHHGGDALHAIEKNIFSGGGFEEYFLTPLLLNSYNAGSKRVADAVILLNETYSNSESARKVFGTQPKYDAFYALTALARKATTHTLSQYDTEAAEYVPHCVAFANLINREQ